MADALRWSQTVIDSAGGDPAKGYAIFGSPLPLALATRGIARAALGRAGWRDDFDQAVVMARSTDPMSHAFAIGYVYRRPIANGVLLADDVAMRDLEEGLAMAERSSEDFALSFAQFALGSALLYRESPAERGRGLEVLGQVRDAFLRGQPAP